MGRVRQGLTYANVMATVAVFVAIGGTSYAALKITGRDVVNGSLTSGDVRNGTLRSADVRNGTLRSADVRDGSLSARDFSSGQLPRGATGLPGVAGPAGPAGARGPEGPRGPSNGFFLKKGSSVALTDAPEFEFREVVRLSLPAGRYLVTGSAVAAKRAGGTLIRCRVDGPGQTGELTSVAVGETAGYAFLSGVHAEAAIASPTGFDAVMRCDKEYTADPAQPTYLESIRIHAVAVETLDVRIVG
jgi:hypothetical protein